MPPELEANEVQKRVEILEGYLEAYGIDVPLALYDRQGDSLPEGVARKCLSLEEAAQADLLLNMFYAAPQDVVGCFSRSALIDIDPGLMQIWTHEELIQTAQHNVYFTIGETVGQPRALFPDCGVPWLYTPPPVFLPAWPVTQAIPGSPYTTVSQWWGEYVEIDNEWIDNSKRASFLDYLELPSRTQARLELALCLGGSNDIDEQLRITQLGWALRSAWDEIPTPQDFHAYVQSSRGEFSCAKPSCMRLQNAWVSDRTLNYLASGKPVIVQHTGESRILPDAQGMFRFRTPQEALEALEAVESDYEYHCARARELAEEHFDATKVVASVLTRAFD